MNAIFMRRVRIAFLWVTLTVSGILLAFSAALLLSGCETNPTQFEIGPVVTPPFGCVEGRKRGVDC